MCAVLYYCPRPEDVADRVRVTHRQGRATGDVIAGHCHCWACVRSSGDDGRYVDELVFCGDRCGGGLAVGFWGHGIGVFVVDGVGEGEGGKTACKKKV